MQKDNIVSNILIEAIKDYTYFIEKNYPYKPIIKIISDKYRLSGVQRTILQRGLTKRSDASSRKMSLVNENKVKDNILLVDTYNVLITIKSYIDGNFLFIGNDGFLRDTSESHGQIKSIEKMKKPCKLLMDFLKTLKTKEIYFYLDSPISNSKKLKDHIKILLDEYNIGGDSEVVRSPDHVLSNSKEGIAATSDSVIIDRNGMIFDLAYKTLLFHFDPTFFSLVDIIY